MFDYILYTLTLVYNLDELSTYDGFAEAGQFNDMLVTAGSLLTSLRPVVVLCHCGLDLVFTQCGLLMYSQ